VPNASFAVNPPGENRFVRDCAAAAVPRWIGTNPIDSSFLPPPLRRFSHHPHADEASPPPGALFALALAAACTDAPGVSVPAPPVDFTRFVDDGGLDRYFKDTKPFYVRRLFGLF
jgi:hypothetical protein